MSAFGFGRRELKKLVTPLLPERLKAPLRGRLFGFRGARVNLPVVFSRDARGPFVTVDDRIVFRFREEERADLRYHLVDNGASIEEMHSFLSLGASADTLFDVGAAKSILAQLFCLSGPGKRAIAYEPSPTLMQAAAALIAMNGCESSIRLRQSAVGERRGRAAGRLHADGLVSVTPAASAGEAVDLEITSLDEEVARLGIEPDLVKIDVEGYEYEVLVGARRLLGTRKPPICLELHLNILEARGLSPRDVVNELVSHGYRFRTCAGRELSAGHIVDSINAVLRFVAI